MTQNQYHELAENFWKYADVKVDYKHPRVYGKMVETFGYLRGIGIGVNAEHIIIASCGYKHAIHYTNVKFPRLK